MSYKMTLTPAQRDVVRAVSATLPDRIADAVGLKGRTLLIDTEAALRGFIPAVTAVGSGAALNLAAKLTTMLPERPPAWVSERLGV